MHVLATLALISLAALAACTSSVAATEVVANDATCEPKPTDPTRFPLDPIERAAGREIIGDDAWTDRRGAYSYVFADQANLAAFRADPARCEIQLGGACARMGPLSGTGTGNVTLHAVPASPALGPGWVSFRSSGGSAFVHHFHERSGARR